MFAALFLFNMDSNLYRYIAASSPRKAAALLRKHGYAPVKGFTLAQCLESLVREEGEPALRDIVDIHPDKNIILEVCAPKETTCNCAERLDKFLNASGPVSPAHKTQEVTHLFIIGASLVLALAIIKSK